ncbi:MAG: 50S ribosomal protein L11 methyltransferase [Desulfobacteraceae bacterium]
MTIARPDQSPYQDLYIYYLKGRVPVDAMADAAAYIGNWEEEEDSFLFFTRSADQLVARVVEQYSHLTLSDRFQMTYDDWQGGALSPMRIGELEVVPAWHHSADSPEDESLLLDPGVVFGAGTHPTTRDCLEAIQMAFARHSMTDVVDLGTGTGLLALAAVKLGARRCVAVDLNRLAVETAMRNVRLNGMTDRIVVAQGDAKNFIDLSCDLMVSNIHYDVMRQIVAAPGFKAMKQFVISGLLRSQADRIERQLLHLGARILQKWEWDGIWFTFHGENVTYGFKR